MRFTQDGLAVATLPVILKARTSKSGQRLIDICASCETVDQEGDVILQAALLNSGEFFVKNGAIDVDHISEIGDRLGIKDPLNYIIGVPLAVYDAGETRTNVTAIIQKGRPKADEFWDSITASPPVRWMASIYGFPHPDGLIKAAEQPGHPLVRATGATRYIVTGLSWRSLAVTRNPICQGLDLVRILANAGAAGVQRAA